MNNSNRIIIFDMDGTLYDLNDVVSSNYEMQVEFLSLKKAISRDESISFLEKNHIYPIIKKDSMSATELFLKIGLDKKEWSLYREQRFDETKIHLEKAVPQSIINSFSQLGIIVLLSSNAYCVIEKILNYLKINPQTFDNIICSDRFPYDSPFNKKKAMEFLSQKYSIVYSDMYSVGDRYSTDIKPMIELGGKGILLRKPLSMQRVLTDLSHDKLQPCSSYNYYE